MELQSAINDPTNLEILEAIKEDVDKLCKKHLYDQINDEDRDQFIDQTMASVAHQMGFFIIDPLIELPKTLEFINDSGWKDDLVLTYIKLHGIDFNELSRIHVIPTQGKYDCGWQAILTFNTPIKRILIEIDLNKSEKGECQ